MDNEFVRKCILEGHQKEKVSLLCMYPDCKSATRWICFECLYQNSHLFDSQDHTKEFYYNQDKLKGYCLKQKEMLEKVSQKLNYKVLTMSQQLLQFIRKIYDYINKVLIIQKDYSQQIKKILDLYEEITQNNVFHELNNDDINLLDLRKIQMLDKQQQQIIDGEQDNTIKLIQDQVDQIKLRFDRYHQNLVNKVKNCSIESKTFNIGSDVHAACLSNDQRHLVTGGIQEGLKIFNMEQGYDIMSYQIVNNAENSEYKHKVQLRSCTFSQDSSLLFIGTFQGEIIGYDVRKDFNLIIRKQIHKNSVNDLRLMNENTHIASCSLDGTIIKFNLRDNKELWKIKAHEKCVLSLELDNKNQSIISCAKDNTIKIWDSQTGQIKIDIQDAHPKQIRQIQFIVNKDLLYSLDKSGELKQWRIDYIKLKAEEINRYLDPFNINYFSQVIENKFLIIINEQKVKIQDNYGLIIREIDHNIKSFDDFSNTQQISSMKAIVVKGKDSICVIKLDI